MGDPFDLTAGWLQGHLLIPLLYTLGLMQWEDVSYGWALFAVYGACQVAITFAVCVPLERWRPVERWPDARAVTVDVFYTIISRVGVLPLFTFVLFYRAQVTLNGFLADHGFVPPTLERLAPFLLGQPVLTFVTYAIILDCADYWRHRLSHQFGWWWALHSLHHAQRQMTFWSDDRNHVLDDLISALWFGVIASGDRRTAAAVPAAGAGAAIPRKPVARQCAGVVRLVGRAAADLAAVPSRASRAARRGAAELQLRRGTAVVGHAVPHRRLQPRLCGDRRSDRQRGAGKRVVSPPAMGRPAAVRRDVCQLPCLVPTLAKEPVLPRIVPQRHPRESGDPAVCWLNVDWIPALAFARAGFARE